MSKFSIFKKSFFGFFDDEGEDGGEEYDEEEVEEEENKVELFIIRSTEALEMSWIE